MLAYTDGSALKNPGPTGAGILIKVQVHKSILVKLAKAISSKGTSFDGELAAILMATQYALTHLTKEHDSFNIYSSSSFRLSGCATCPITPHTRENYHNNTISLIRENLIEISLRISSIKMIYCPGHKGVCENEIADSLAKTGAKKARHLPCEMTATKEKIKKVIKKLTLQKRDRRWQNTKSNMYKILISNLTSDGIKQRALHLSFTTRNGASNSLIKIGPLSFELPQK